MNSKEKERLRESQRELEESIRMMEAPMTEQETERNRVLEMRGLGLLIMNSNWIT